MARKTNFIGDVLICLIGFALCATIAAFFTDASDGASLVPDKIEWLFDGSELMARQRWIKNFEPNPETEVLQ
jgi:hypothetical protein